ncbi:MAG: putative sugar nucleotidyl transferase [Crocinitomicaceae bacterium]|nr:putative sugar nucleotidyl transferase [Crocinitomicaceae bacterium]
MKIILHDNQLNLRCAPLTLTRPVGNLRMGILTNDERWKMFIPSAHVFFQTESYLATKFPSSVDVDLIVNAAVIPTQALIDAVQMLNVGEELSFDNQWVARKGSVIQTNIAFKSDLIILENRWDIFQKNGAVLKADYDLITQGRTSQPLSKTNTVIGDSNLIFLEEGAKCEASILNTNEGPIYIGKNAEIMEGSIVRGPLALCESAGLKLGTKVYGPTTLGPHCKVGGEVNNVVFQSYSNKGHDGFLGNSVIGEWCNLGADTNCSNLKNNYSSVSTYSYETKNTEQTDVQFMGLMMGDHSKSGINTMFNTATVVGVSANVFGAGFPEKKIDSFSWSEGESTVPFRLDKAIEVAKAMMGRRNVEFTKGDLEIFEFLAGKDM